MSKARLVKPNRNGWERLGLPEGYLLEHVASGHMRVICPDGTALRRPNGIPMTVACSPSDHRTRKTEAAVIKRALRLKGEA